MAKAPIRVAVTGAAGQIGYALLFRIASGEMLGKDQPVILQLLEIPDEKAQKALKGVMMELDDCAFPLLHGMVPASDPMVAFKDAGVALLVLLVDRTLFAGSFRAAWQRRSGFYWGLASAWILLALIVYKMGGTRGEAAGFGAGGITWWSYFLRQWEAICVYLKLVVWPHPLIVDYGYDVVGSVRSVALYGAILFTLGGLTVFGLWRNSRWALPATAFFLLLGTVYTVPP